MNGSHPCPVMLTTSPYSYDGKFCPLSETGFKFFTFICDVSSGSISWELDDLDRTIYDFESLDPKRRERRGSTSKFKYHIVIHLTENNIDDDIHAMRSSLTIFPYNHNLSQFPVVCSTECGGQLTGKSEIYRVAGE
jgi:hypothetical protein